MLELVHSKRQLYTLLTKWSDSVLKVPVPSSSGAFNTKLAYINNFGLKQLSTTIKLV